MLLLKCKLQRQLRLALRSRALLLALVWLGRGRRCCWLGLSRRRVRLKRRQCPGDLTVISLRPRRVQSSLELWHLSETDDEKAEKGKNKSISRSSFFLF